MSQSPHVGSPLIWLWGWSVCSCFLAGCGSELDEPLGPPTSDESTVASIAPVETHTPDEDASPPPDAAIKGEVVEITIHTRYRGLLNRGWDREAAATVCDLLNEPVDVARQSKLDDSGLWRDLEKLGKLTQIESGLMTFIRKRPEAAILLARSSEPSGTLALLDGDDYYPLFAIFSRLVD